MIDGMGGDSGNIFREGTKHPQTVIPALINVILVLVFIILVLINVIPALIFVIPAEAGIQSSPPASSQPSGPLLAQG